MRILALDWGTIRIGAAISDQDRKIAFPFDKFIESKNAGRELKKIVDELEIGKILIGLPKGLSGQETESTSNVRKFVFELQKLITVPIEMVDERYSSQAAGKSLAAEGMKESDQREIKDNIAAHLMLQQYLDNLTVKRQ